MTLKQEHEDRRILVVDDHEISGTHAMAVLIQGPVAVRWAKTAGEALKLALNWYPHIIFLDLHLPDNNGLAIIRRIRAEWPESRPAAKVIITTGDGSGLPQAELELLDIDRVLAKPVSGEQFRDLAGLVEPVEIRESWHCEPHSGLPGLFRAELRQRLPELDSSLAALDREKTAGILHQLIASAAMCGEFPLESALRTLDAHCRQETGGDEVAGYYHALLELAREFIERED